MQLVIRVDLDKTNQPLPEVFKLIANCASTDEAEAGIATPIRDNRSTVIGEWDIEETENVRHPLESRYRAAAVARYARAGQIEIDRFATVSQAADGAYVQGWLFVPSSDVSTTTHDSAIPRKPPQSISSARNENRNAG